MAVLIAYWRVLFGGEEGYMVLGRLIRERWDKAPYHWYLAYSYTRTVLWPLAWSSVVLLLTGHPGAFVTLAVLVPSVAACVAWPQQVDLLIRYTSILSIAGPALLIAVLSAIEFVGDPLGIESSTRDVRRAATAARKALPVNALRRTGILISKGAIPLELLVNSPTREVEAGGDAERSSASKKAD